MNAENNKDLCVVCVSSTKDRKEEERVERIVMIICTSFKQIGTLISVSMMPVRGDIAPHHRHPN